MAVEADWSPAPLPPAAADLAREGIPEVLAELLARRGVSDLAAAEAFLRPSLDHLHDPYLLAGMEGAVERLEAARERGEAVAVVGDYDVDGVSSTALLVAVFGALKVKAHPVMPHRLREGYGFQPVHVERAAELGCSLIVTADCGTTSMAAVEAARRAGIDVVITDHHLPGDSPPPEAVVMINPRQEGCPYPFPELAGVGLALKLALAFARRAGRDLPPRQLLRIACLGTIADLVPLVGENRVIAALGLEALASTRSPGLRALMRRAGLKAPLRAADVGYRIGPRLNAAGRLASPEEALELLLVRDRRRAEALAEELEVRNRDRQQEERKVVEEAREQLLDREPLPPVAVAWSEGWHRGVVGIAAGRLARELHRPTLLLAVEEGSATGSGRSVPGLHLHDFLARWRNRYERFGGHAQAVGLTVEAESLEDLRGTWEDAAAGWPPEILRRRYEYELELPPSRVDRDLLAELRRLEPHGQQNPAPLLRVGPLSLARAPRIFGRGHLSATARGEDGGRVQLLGWGWEEHRGRLDGRFEVLGYLEHDDYRRAPVLRLAAARPWSGPG